ncbi:hypothetical protein F0562_000568 [Nyssa sinensis]|uniref:Uncharacterized protein n=1 Tax=Nyssa sinensis TaxID=561372 RepID=A0A5J5C212_9ASTE|nr:hypothetical protein F0562_000568 [Nyssa sinensis]
MGRRGRGWHQREEEEDTERNGEEWGDLSIGHQNQRRQRVTLLQSQATNRYSKCYSEAHQPQLFKPSSHTSQSVPTETLTPRTTTTNIYKPMITAAPNSAPFLLVNTTSI